MKKSNLIGGGKEKIVLLLATMILAHILSGCSPKKSPLSTAISQIDHKSSGHAQQLHDYDSPYTICYQNKDDTYSMYIFASPIQFKINDGYQIIDNTIVKSNRKEFEFENKANEIKTYFPEKLTDYFLVERGEDSIQFKPHFDVTGFSTAKSKVIENMYGDWVSTVVYESKDMDLIFYPTKAGIRTEIINKLKMGFWEFKFIMVGPETKIENENTGYLLLKREKKNVGIVYLPRTSDNLLYNTEINLDLMSIEQNKKIITYQFTKRFDKAEFAVEFYFNKIPDKAVYGVQKDNGYLSNYCQLINEDDKNLSYQYFRLRLNYFMTVKPDSIMSSQLCLRALNNEIDTKEITIKQVEKQWSSMMMNWADKSEAVRLMSEGAINDSSYTKMEITDFIKNCFQDPSGDLESIGGRIELKSSGKLVLATSDDSLYPPYLEIRLKKEPEYFIPKENINDNIT